MTILCNKHARKHNRRYWCQAAEQEQGHVCTFIRCLHNYRYTNRKYVDDVWSFTFASLWRAFDIQLEEFHLFYEGFSREFRIWLQEFVRSGWTNQVLPNQARIHQKITSLCLRLCAKLQCHVETGNACSKTLVTRLEAHSCQKGCKVKIYPNENYKLKPQKTAAGKSDMGVTTLFKNYDYDLISV